jgi:Ser/Thr protein kinase RdoA (MazF antagonist)
MDQLIKDRYNDTILEEAMRRYGITKDQIRILDSFESFIYEFEHGAESYILRIGHSVRKSESLIQGEVHWINYLSDGGVSVARAISSKNGKLVESIDDGQGGQFLITAFMRAEGQKPWDAGWTPARFENYGHLLGQMHALAVDYQAIPTWERPAWDDDGMKFVEMYLPASETIVHQKYQSVLKHIYSLPKSKTSYGLIHQDAHQNNLFMDGNGKITLFDFDDCVYSWFINDIAIVLFYISMDAEELGYPNAASFTRDFMIHFLCGYRRAYRLDPHWLKEIPTFLKLRELELYAVVFRDFDIKDIDHWSIESFKQIQGFNSNSGNDMWIANFMHDRKFRIEQDQPFIDFEFMSLSEYL